MRVDVTDHDLYAKIGILTIQVDELAKLAQSLLNEKTALEAENKAFKEALAQAEELEQSADDKK